jgi:hypothetical protein
MTPFALLVVWVGAIGAFSLDKHVGSLALGSAFVVSILMLAYRRRQPVPPYEPRQTRSAEPAKLTHRQGRDVDWGPRLGVGLPLVLICPVLAFGIALGADGSSWFQFLFVEAFFAVVPFFVGVFLIASAARFGLRRRSGPRLELGVGVALVLIGPVLFFAIGPGADGGFAWEESLYLKAIFAVAPFFAGAFLIASAAMAGLRRRSGPRLAPASRTTGPTGNE